MDEKRVAMLPVFFVGGGEGGGDAITAQRKKRMRREAAPKARPTEKGNLRGDKGGGERGRIGAYPLPLPKGGEKATPDARPAEKRKGRL